MVFESAQLDSAGCALCYGPVRPGEPGYIPIQEQLLTFTQRSAIDTLAHVLSCKTAALAAWRWMCPSCYAQMELLDKYEQDRRVLLKRTEALRGELVGLRRTGERTWRRRTHLTQPPDDETGTVDVEVASNGAQSDPEPDNYVEVKLENIAAVTWPAEDEHADTNGELETVAQDADVDVEGADSESHGDVDEDPLADVVAVGQGRTSPVPAASPASVEAVAETTVDPLGDDDDDDDDVKPLHVSVRRPVGAGAAIATSVATTTGAGGTAKLTYVGEIKGVRLGGDMSSLPTIDVQRLQSSVQRSLNAASDPAGTDVTASRKRAASGEPESAPPVKVIGVSLPRPSAPATLKTLLPKLPQIPVATGGGDGAAPAAEPAAQPPLLLQSVDGKLYMLPPGAPAAVPAPPLTLLRLPDGRIVMPTGAAPTPAAGKTTAETTTATTTTTAATPPPPPRGLGSAANSSASSTLKTLLLGQQTRTTATGTASTATATAGGGGGGTTAAPAVSRCAPKPPAPVIAPVTLPSGIQNPAALTPAAASRMGLRLSAEPCPLCSLIFGSRELVDRHLRSHTMVCSSCDLLFASRLGLFEHRQVCAKAQEAPPMPPVPVHLVDKGLTCNLCGAMVSQPILMNEHASREHGLLYRCPKCDCTTAVLREYLHHVRESHGLDSPHPCNLCQTSFSKRDTQRRHFENKHSVSVERPATKDRTIDGVRLRDVRAVVDDSMMIVKEEEDVSLL